MQEVVLAECEESPDMGGLRIAGAEIRKSDPLACTGMIEMRIKGGTTEFDAQYQDIAMYMEYIRSFWAFCIVRAPTRDATT